MSILWCLSLISNLNNSFYFIQQNTKYTNSAQYKELTPNLTRRAQCANWLIFYRDELFGYTLEELKERRQRKREAEELAKQKEDKEDEWSPPIREVY